MPVTDLADYLGMPQQAPANPVFNQTRRSTGIASLDQRADDIYKGGAAMDQLARLQRQAPVLQAQQAQLAYDEVAQQANDLRMKQEIEAQVERAANELAGGNLNPESDDFAVKYRDLATRNPLAMSDPRFRQVAGIYEGQNQSYRQTRAAQAEAEARAAQARIDAANSARAFGVPGITDDMSVQDIKVAQGNWKNANTGKRGGTQDVTRQMMEKDYELINKERDDMKKEGENVIYDANGVEMPNPEFQKLDEEWRILRDKLRGFYQSKYSPEEETQTTRQQAGGAAIPFRPPEAPAPASFKETMKGLATPKAEDILKVDESEVIRDINDPSADENTYVAAISDPKTSPEVKRQALDRLRQFAEKPKKISGLTIEAAQARKTNLRKMVDDAERQIRIAPEVGRYNKAWDAEKAKVAGWINEFADELGVEPDELENSLAAGGAVEKSGAFDVQGQQNTYRDQFEAFLRKKMGGESPLSTKAEKLKAFQRSEFAKELGENLSPVDKLQLLAGAGLSFALSPIFGSDAAQAVSKILPDKSKTYGDVLDVYLAEKAAPQSQANPASQEAIVDISTKEEVDVLPKGSKFRGPDGKVRIK